MKKRVPVLKDGKLLRDENGNVMEFWAVNQEELDGKIDAPQTAKNGEVLTVEEVNEDGKPIKWKTAGNTWADVQNKPFSSIGEGLEVKEGVLMADTSAYDNILAAIDQAVFDKNLLVDILAGTCENLTGDSITAIADYLFYNKGSLKTIDLPNCVTIGERAFSSCTSLTTANLPMCTSIGISAFYGTKALKAVSLPNLQTLSEYAFYNSGIEVIDDSTFPKIVDMPKCCFIQSKNLKEVTSTNIKTLGYGAFQESTVENVNLPNVTKIGERPFQGCQYLKSAIFPPDVDEVGIFAFSGAISLTTISAMPKLKIIPNGAFRNCVRLTGIESEGFETVGNEAFYSCAFTEFNGKNLTSLGQSVFGDCVGLRKVYIGENCTTIKASRYSYSPFYRCTNSALKIFCGATSKPDGWENYWNYINSSKQATVVWGATLEDYEAY